MSRTQERHDLADPVRIRLLEADQDKADEVIAVIEERFTESVKVIDARLSKILWALVSVCISVTTGVLLYAVTSVAK